MGESTRQRHRCRSSGDGVEVTVLVCLVIRAVLRLSSFLDFFFSAGEQVSLDHCLVLDTAEEGRTEGRTEENKERREGTVERIDETTTKGMDVSTNGRWVRPLSV